jgi:hydrogenase maturation protease
MPFPQTPASDFWIIGYGNSQRRDDGIGPYIIERLQRVVEVREEVCLLTLQQLVPDVVDTLKHAGMLLFVDATVTKSAAGRQWIRICPEANAMPYLTHQVTPSFILWLLQSLYHRNPTAWIVSVQGDDFGFGGVLSSEAQKRVQHVTSEIIEFILTYLSKKDNITSILTKRNWNRRPK